MRAIAAAAPASRVERSIAPRPPTRMSGRRSTKVPRPGRRPPSSVRSPWSAGADSPSRDPSRRPGHWGRIPRTRDGGGTAGAAHRRTSFSTLIANDPGLPGSFAFRGRSAASGQRLAGLHERLEPAQDVHPAAGDVLRRLRGTVELVVDDRELGHAAVRRLELPCHAAVLLAGQLLVVEGAPAVAQAPRRIRLEHLTVDPELLLAGRVRPERSARLERRVDVAAVEVPARELRLGDRVPDLLRRRLDEHLVDLRGADR